MFIFRLKDFDEDEEELGFQIFNCKCIQVRYLLRKSGGDALRGQVMKSKVGLRSSFWATVGTSNKSAYLVNIRRGTKILIDLKFFLQVMGS